MNLDDVEPIIVEGRIKIPYRWPAGKVAGRFLEEWRNNGKLFGMHCARCEKVFVPPRPLCIGCNGTNWEWKQVGPEGTVITWTRTKDAVFALVQPDGADTAILERLYEDEVKTGMRVMLGAAE